MENKSAILHENAALALGRPPRVAFVHDWLVTYRGGEKVLEALLSLYPEAPIYTLFYRPSAMPQTIRSRTVHVPRWLNAMLKLRKALLPILPWAIESIDFSGYDLLISTSSCVAKGAKAAPGARHLCYLHSPMRYIWDQQEEYLAGVSHIPGAAAAIRALTPALRRWDVRSAARVDRFVANSTFVAARAHEFYGREASVVHPPLELGRFAPRTARPAGGPYFLAAGALVSYKRFDLAIRAAAAAQKKLIIAGSGPMEASLRRLAASLPLAATEFISGPDDEQFANLLAGAEALVFPGVEDFGMVAIEAMASGTPVIAYMGGGARDFIEPGRTGRFFAAPTVEALAAELTAFNRQDFPASALVDYAQRFSRSEFINKMRLEIDKMLATEPAVAKAGATQT